MNPEAKPEPPSSAEPHEDSSRAAAPPVEDTKGAPEVSRPEKPKPGAVDPLKTVRRAALACRQRFDAIRGAKITVDYAVGSDGSVTRAVPTVDSDLGRCLAESIRSATFPPKLRLGLKIDL